MAKAFNELINNMPQERRERISALTQELLANMPIDELRRARELTQQQVASTLHLNLAEISEIEGETDLYLSTFRRFMQAMGGDLEVIAHFPDKQITIDAFQQFAVSDKDEFEERRHETNRTA